MIMTLIIANMDYDYDFRRRPVTHTLGLSRLPFPPVNWALKARWNRPSIHRPSWTTGKLSTLFGDMVQSTRTT